MNEWYEVSFLEVEVQLSTELMDSVASKVNYGSARSVCLVLVCPLKKVINTSRENPHFVSDMVSLQRGNPYVFCRVILHHVQTNKVWHTLYLSFVHSKLAFYAHANGFVFNFNFARLKWWFDAAAQAHYKQQWNHYFIGIQLSDKENRNVNRKQNVY